MRYHSIGYTEDEIFTFQLKGGTTGTLLNIKTSFGVIEPYVTGSQRPSRTSAPHDGSKFGSRGNVGLIVGALASLAVVTGVIVFLERRRKHPLKQQSEMNIEDPTYMNAARPTHGSFIHGTKQIGPASWSTHPLHPIPTPIPLQGQR
ncbi:hypothetical protein BG011_004384, partial [Mortierella polycephala]